MALSCPALLDDEVNALKDAGVKAYNFYGEAGVGLAEAAYEKLEDQIKANT